MKSSVFVRVMIVAWTAAVPSALKKCGAAQLLSTISSGASRQRATS